jgi:hypothetical protein
LRDARTRGRGREGHARRPPRFEDLPLEQGRRRLGRPPRRAGRNLGRRACLAVQRERLPAGTRHRAHGAVPVAPTAGDAELYLHAIGGESTKKSARRPFADDAEAPRVTPSAGSDDPKDDAPAEAHRSRRRG